MENNLEIKYQKLATEYSKLRAQASVLKKAVLEEQTKNSTLRDGLRQKESSLRRAEQEVDSLGFRNKQLEHRVAALQEDFEKETKKINGSNKISSTKLLKINYKTNSSSDLHALPQSLAPTAATAASNLNNDPMIFEELQKKIMENAKLTSLIDDKDNENKLYLERLKDLEKQLEKQFNDSNELEKRLRRDLDMMVVKNSELENKLVEVPSMIGSEDNLSASGSDITNPIHTTNSSSSDHERISNLQKEVFHWRTQYEILKISDFSLFNNSSKEKILNNGVQTTPQHIRKEVTADKDMTLQVFEDPKNKEDLIFQHFSKKVEDLLKSKCMAESKLNSYVSECESLQINLENVIKELKQSQRNLIAVEEDLTTTRINYEEQISVLTEQLINLSDQLAASK